MSARPSKVQHEMKRLWGDFPVVDASSELRVFPNAKDIHDGRPKDPTNCAFSQACKRLYGSSKVMFLRNVAYVDLPQADGSRRVERFMLTQPMRRLIEEFDQTGVASPGGYVLRPPTPSFTFEGRKEYNDRRQGRERVEHGPYGKRTDPLTLAGVRNGAGAVQAAMTLPR